MGEHDDEDPEEDPSEEHEPEDDHEDKDLEDDPNEEHKPEDEDTKEEEPSEGFDETKPFEEDETAVTAPPPRHCGARISIKPLTSKSKQLLQTVKLVVVLILSMIVQPPLAALKTCMLRETIKHLDKFLHVTQSIKVNGVIDDALCLYLFPHSLKNHATAWFDRLPRNSINTFEQMVKMFLGKYFPPSMVTKLRNEITNFRQRPDESLFKAWERYKLSIDRCPNHNMLPVTQIDTFYNSLSLRHYDTINVVAAQRSDSSSSITSSYDLEIAALKAEMAEINKNLIRVLQPPLAKPRTYMLREPIKVIHTNLKMNNASSSGSRTLPGNTITNLKEDLKGITTQSGTTYQGPTIPTTFSSLPQVVECEIEVTKYMMPPTNNGSTKYIQPLVVQVENLILNSELVVAPIIESVVAPVSALKSNQKPSIPYPSRLHDQKLRDKANDQKEKFFQIFQDLNSNISFVDALILMPKMDESLALADLGASINLMPLSIWNKLSLPELSPTCMTLELTDRSISHPIGVAKDVFVKTERALIDVFEGELTLRVGKEAITFNLDQTSRYSANYNDMTANRIDVIVMACEEYSQEVLSFSDVIASGNPTPYYDLIVSTSSSTLTPFEDSDFLLEEVDAFLAFEDDPTSPEEISCLKFEKNLKFVKLNDKSSMDEPPEVELKDLPPHLEYAFLEGNDKLPVIIAKDLSDEEKTALINVLKSHKRAITWKLSDIKAIRKDHFPLPFMDQMLERLAGNEYYCFLDGFSGYFQIPIDPKDQEKTTFTYPYGMFAYRRMPFGLCNAPATFQRCMMAIFRDMIEKTMEVFMDDFSVFGNSFETCFSHLEKMLKRCEDTNLCLNWEKIHFIVKEGIVLGHKISKNEIEVDKAKVDVIAKLPHYNTPKITTTQRNTTWGATS
nr:reverse transcriptase domain-containing protein [Tanacetum cinerariifolium]